MRELQDERLSFAGVWWKASTKWDYLPSVRSWEKGDGDRVFPHSMSLAVALRGGESSPHLPSPTAPAPPDPQVSLLFSKEGNMDFLDGTSYVAFCAQERNSFFLVNNAWVFSQQLECSSHTALSLWFRERWQELFCDHTCRQDAGVMEVKKPGQGSHGAGAHHAPTPGSWLLGLAVKTRWRTPSSVCLWLSPGVNQDRLIFSFLQLFQSWEWFVDGGEWFVVGREQFTGGSQWFTVRSEWFTVGSKCVAVDSGWFTLLQLVMNAAHTDQLGWFRQSEWHSPVASVE